MRTTLAAFYAAILRHNPSSQFSMFFKMISVATVSLVCPTSPRQDEEEEEEENAGERALPRHIDSTSLLISCATAYVWSIISLGSCLLASASMLDVSRLWSTEPSW